MSFEEACRIFFDPLHLIVEDQVVDQMVDCEQRWQALGSAQEILGTVLIVVVAHTVREELEEVGWIEIVRIISARKATRQESRIYEEESGWFHT